MRRYHPRARLQVRCPHRRSRAWLPITNEKGFEESISVKADATEEKKKLKEEGARKKQEEEKRIMKEIREREEEIKNAKDYNEDPTSLDFYTMNRTTWMWASEQITLWQPVSRTCKKRPPAAGSCWQSSTPSTLSTSRRGSLTTTKSVRSLVSPIVPNEAMEKRYVDILVAPTVGPIGKPGEVGVQGVGVHAVGPRGEVNPIVANV